MPGIMLHIDGSKHAWFQDDRYYDLIVILDDATSEIYYAQLVTEESTLTTMGAVCEVIEHKGLFCSLYSDRGSHFFYTPKAGEAVDKGRLTQFGRALRELNIHMIPAYSPQARGRMERSYLTWRGRLPQELRLAGIGTREEANRFLRERYIAEFNRKFTVKPAQPGTSFRKCGRRNLDLVFSLQTTNGGPGQHGGDRGPLVADRKMPLEADAGSSDGDHPSAPGRPSFHSLGAASGGLLPGRPWK